MFHTYVTAQSGNKVDIDRASYLMDKELYQEALDAIPTGREGRAMVVWGYYCAAHFQKYGEPFICDVDPYWDNPGPPPVHPLTLEE